MKPTSEETVRQHLLSVASDLGVKIRWFDYGWQAIRGECSGQGATLDELVMWLDGFESGLEIGVPEQTPATDTIAYLALPVLDSPQVALRVARAALQSKAAYIRGAIDSCEARAASAEGPVPDACRLLIHTYRDALAPINTALLALATEGTNDGE